jgi:hypothetical protein
VERGLKASQILFIYFESVLEFWTWKSTSVGIGKQRDKGSFEAPMGFMVGFVNMSKSHKRYVFSQQNIFAKGPVFP